MKLLCLVVLLFTLTLSWSAEHDVVRREVQAGKLKPLAEILQAVQRRHPGRVLDVELERGSDERRWYEVKLLHRDGHRVEIYMDAVSGAEIRRPEAPPSSILSMATVLQGLLAIHPGNVMEVELETLADQQPVYQVHLLLNDDSDRLLRVDANTGKPLHTPVLDRRLASSLKPLAEVLEAVERRHAGRAIEAEIKRNRQGRVYYEIEILLDNGRGVEVNVDAVSGALLSEDELR